MGNEFYTANRRPINATLIMNVPVFFSLPFPFLFLFFCLSTYHEIPLYLYI